MHHVETSISNTPLSSSMSNTPLPSSIANYSSMQSISRNTIEIYSAAPDQHPRIWLEETASVLRSCRLRKQEWAHQAMPYIQGRAIDFVRQDVLGARAHTNEPLPWISWDRLYSILLSAFDEHAASVAARKKIDQLGSKIIDVASYDKYTKAFRSYVRQLTADLTGIESIRPQFCFMFEDRLNIEMLSRPCTNLHGLYEAGEVMRRFLVRKEAATAIVDPPPKQTPPLEQENGRSVAVKLENIEDQHAVANQPVNINAGFSSVVQPVTSDTFGAVKPTTVFDNITKSEGPAEGQVPNSRALILQDTSNIDRDATVVFATQVVKPVAPALPIKKAFPLTLRLTDVSMCIFTAKLHKMNVPVVIDFNIKPCLVNPALFDVSKFTTPVKLRSPLILFRTKENVPVTATRAVQMAPELDPRAPAMSHQFFLVNLLAYPVLLGSSWLERHKVSRGIGGRTPELILQTKGKSLVIQPTAAKPSESNWISVTEVDQSLKLRFPSVFDRNNLGKSVYDIPEHSIETKPNASPAVWSARDLNRCDRSFLKSFIDEGLRRGFIRPSTSRWAAPVFVKRNPGETPQVIVNYKSLNQATLISRDAMPSIENIFWSLRGAKQFTFLTLKSAELQIRICEADRPKTAFVSEFGLFEFNVMYYGLANNHYTMQCVMDYIFRDLKESFVVTYLEDILIYSNSKKQHVKHVQKVLSILKHHGMVLDDEKCIWGQPEIKFLSHIVSGETIKIDPEKIQRILQYKTPECWADVSSFLNLTGFYHWFIPMYDEKIKLLSAGLNGDCKFSWTDALSREFASLKQSFAIAPIRYQYDPTAPCFIKTYSFGTFTGSMLAQMQGNVQEAVLIGFECMRNTAYQAGQTREAVVAEAILHALNYWKFFFSNTAVTVYVDRETLQRFESERMAEEANMSRVIYQIKEFNPKLSSTFEIPADVLDDNETLRVGDWVKRIYPVCSSGLAWDGPFEVKYVYTHNSYGVSTPNGFWMGSYKVDLLRKVAVTSRVLNLWQASEELKLNDRLAKKRKLSD